MGDMTVMHRETEQLGAYALGALDGREAAAMAAHVGSCPTCRRELAELEKRQDHDVRPESLDRDRLPKVRTEVDQCRVALDDRADA